MIPLKRVCEIWNSFWFSPESAVPVAVFRILFGLLVLQFCWFMSGELHWMLGPKGVVSQAANNAWTASPRINLLAMMPLTDANLDLFWLAFTVAAACLTLGLFTRASAIIVYLCLISCDARNSFIFTGADNMLRVESFLLIFSQAGAMLSLDRVISVWCRKKLAAGPPPPSSPWGLKLIQVQIALCYWAAFSSKINGYMWIDGSAVFYVTHIIEENKYAIPYVYDHLWTCKLLTWFTLVIEFALAVLIWIKDLRLPIILLAIPFHLALDYTLIIPQFQFVMIASLMAFIEPSTYSKMAAAVRLWIARLAGPPLKAAYDGSVDLSCRLAETIRRLDLFRLIELTDVCQDGSPRSQEQLSAVLGHAAVGIFSSDGQAGTVSGAQALRRIAARLPLLAPLTPLFYLPGCDGVVRYAARLLERLYSGKPVDSAPAGCA